MGYYKQIETLIYQDGFFSALGTKSEMAKRHVTIEESVEIENKVDTIQLISYRNMSGAVEFGTSVELECTFKDGYKTKTYMDGLDYLQIIKTHDSFKGKTHGDFLFLMQGTVHELVVRNSVKHKTFLEMYEEQENKKKKQSEYRLQEGDIVDVAVRSVYLGEYFYYKPNFRNENYYNKLRKYKVYIGLDKDNNLTDDIHLVAGKSSKEPTKKLGTYNFDFKELQDEAKEHLTEMYKEDIGYRVGHMWYNHKIIYELKNEKAFILAHIARTKEVAEHLKEDKEYLLKNIQMFGWKKALPKGKFTVEYDRRFPYQYKEVN